MNLRPIRTQRILRRCGFCIAIFALAGIAHVLSIANPSGEWQAFFPKCMFFLATGLHCPGCGCQRAIHHLFNGRILLALQCNAMVIIALPWLTWEAARASLLFLEFPLPQILAVRWRLSGKQAMSIAIAVMAFWVLRNIPCRPFEWLAPPVTKAAFAFLPWRKFPSCAVSVNGKLEAYPTTAIATPAAAVKTRG